MGTKSRSNKGIEAGMLKDAWCRAPHRPPQAVAKSLTGTKDKERPSHTNTGGGLSAALG